ncbi:hypothetical protein TNCV_3739591 [Trichonephila clavipes]|nr:hypothetical protein TNCV_3739591 [Trichonephila clavipes]
MPIYSIKEVSGDFTDSLSDSGNFKVSSKIDVSHIPVGIENLSHDNTLGAFKLSADKGIIFMRCIFKLSSNLCNVLSESESFKNVQVSCKQTSETRLLLVVWDLSSRVNLCYGALLSPFEKMKKKKKYKCSSEPRIKYQERSTSPSEKGRAGAGMTSLQWRERVGEASFRFLTTG